MRAASLLLGLAVSSLAASTAGWSAGTIGPAPVEATPLDSISYNENVNAANVAFLPQRAAGRITSLPRPSTADVNGNGRAAPQTRRSFGNTTRG